jgi:hypothetical protein
MRDVPPFERRRKNARRPDRRFHKLRPKKPTSQIAWRRAASAPASSRRLLSHRRGKLAYIRHGKASLSVPDDELWPTLVGDHRGYSGRQSLENDVTEGIRARGESEHIHVSVGAGQRITLKYTGKSTMVQIFPEPRLEHFLADDEEAEVLAARLQKRFLQLDQEAVVLFDGKAAYISEREEPGDRSRLVGSKSVVSTPRPIRGQGLPVDFSNRDTSSQFGANRAREI